MQCTRQRPVPHSSPRGGMGKRAHHFEQKRRHPVLLRCCCCRCRGVRVRAFRRGGGALHLRDDADLLLAGDGRLDGRARHLARELLRRSGLRRKQSESEGEARRAAETGDGKQHRGRCHRQAGREGERGGEGAREQRESRERAERESRERAERAAASARLALFALAGTRGGAAQQRRGRGGQITVKSEAARRSNDLQRSSPRAGARPRSCACSCPCPWTASARTHLPTMTRRCTKA